MFIFLAILFPVVLLGGVLAMERIERQFAEQTDATRARLTSEYPSGHG